MTTVPFTGPIDPMLAKAYEGWPPPGGPLAYEPKWDGFRAISWHDGAELKIESRSRKSLLRYFPELPDAVAALPPGTVVDGEILVVMGDASSFDALQLRIHPAQSRIARLSVDIPATLVAFDLLALSGEDLRGEPFRDRRRLLVELARTLPKPWVLTPSTTDENTARDWFNRFESAGCDGLIAKPLDDSYHEGKRVLWKVKRRRTVDCVVGGFREHKDGGMIGSLLLGLYNGDGGLEFVGHCSGFSDADRAAILGQLQSLATESSFGGDGVTRIPGAEGRWTSGRDRSWTPIAPGVVVEVSYDQIEGNRFRSATRFHRWRPDKPARECTIDQLERREGPGFSDLVSQGET